MKLRRAALRTTLVAATSALVVAAGCASPPEWVREGAPTPAIEGRTVDGQKVSLAAERGKVAVVVFFADWCTRCRDL